MSNSKRKKKKDNKLHVLLVLTCFVLIIALIGTVFNDYRTIVKNRRETNNLETKYQELLEEETSLNSEVVKLQDPVFVARYAREKYLYSKNGETILRIVDPDKYNSKTKEGNAEN